MGYPKRLDVVALLKPLPQRSALVAQKACREIPPQEHRGLIVLPGKEGGD